MLDEIGWAEPLFPLPEDPQWAATLTEKLGGPRACYMYAAPSRWLREGLLHAAQLSFPEAGKELSWLAILVTSQENACRYCYGAARAYLKLLGLSEAKIDQVEREVKLAGGDPKERALLQYCRNLSRSMPRPVRADVDALVEMGYTPALVTEIAFTVVSSAFTNRFSTFIASPLEGGLEEMVEKPLFRLARPFMLRKFRRFPRPLELEPPPAQGGPFGELVGLIEGTEGAAVLDRMIRGMLAADVLPPRTIGWMFAVIATALDCRLCSEGSRQLLEREGVAPDRIDAVLQALAGPELDATEAKLLPWVRETVHYETEVIQRKTHELAREVDPTVLLEAIGVASLANACSRLSMLEQ